MEPAILCHTLKIAPGSVASGLAAKLAAASETARPLFCMPTSIAIAVVLEYSTWKIFAARRPKHHTTEIVDRHYSKHQNSTAYDLLCIYSHDSSDDHNNSYNRDQRHNIGYFIYMLSCKGPEKSQKYRNQNYFYHREHHCPEDTSTQAPARIYTRNGVIKRSCQSGNDRHSHRKCHITACNIGDHIAGCSAGQQPTRITPRARSAGRFITLHSIQATTGMIVYCATAPIITSLVWKKQPEVFHLMVSPIPNMITPKKYRCIIGHPCKSIPPEKGKAWKRQ